MQVDGQAVLPCLTLMEAGCALAAVSKDDSIAASPVLIGAAFHTGTMPIPISGLVCVEISQTGGLQVSSSTFYQTCGESNTTAMSSLITSTQPSSLQKALLKAKAHQSKATLLQKSKDRTQHKRNLCPMHTMALVANARLTGKADDFWVQPGVAEAMMQLNAFVHKELRGTTLCSNYLQPIATKAHAAR